MEVWSQGSFLLYGLTFFTEGGYKSAAKSFNEDISLVNLAGKSVIVTGANSGIGKGSCKYFAERGAVVHMICRNEERGTQALNELKEQTHSKYIHLYICDLAEPKQIHSFVEKFLSDDNTVDIIVNNAGVMLQSCEVNSEGMCSTFSVNTLSNFLLTTLLIPTLLKSDDPRVIYVSSGGMLTEKLLVNKNYLNQKGNWSGRTAYARTKRHQVVLAKKFSTEYPGIKFYSMHPGWTATAAVETAMPDFYESMKEKLRPIEHGCDTICWLSVTNSLTPEQNGEFFRDRKPEIQHFCISKTRYSQITVECLWNWCKECCGLGPNPEELRKLANDIQNLMQNRGQIKTRQSGLTSHKKTVTGVIILESIKETLELGGTASLKKALWLEEAGYIHSISSSGPFKPNSDLYRFYPIPTNEELKELVCNERIEEILKFVDLERNGEEWELTKNFGDEDQTIAYLRSIPGSKIKACKVHTRTNATVDELQTLLYTNHLERLKEWNHTFSEGRVISYVSPNIEAQYWRFNVPPLDPRDFVIIKRRKKLPGGAVVIYEKSIVHGKAPPDPKKKVIRCEMPYEIRYFKPIDPNNEKAGSIIVMSNQTDIKGWIPTSVTNSSNVDISKEELTNIKRVAVTGREEKVIFDEQVLTLTENETTASGGEKLKSI